MPVGPVAFSAPSVFSHNHFLSPALVHPEITVQLASFEINVANTDKERAPEGGVGMDEVVSKSAEDIQAWVPLNIDQKPLYEAALMGAIVYYKNNPSEAAFVIAARVAQVVMQYANYFHEDMIYHGLVFDTTLRNVQKKQPLPVFIILTTRGLFPTVEEKLLPWDHDSNFWLKYTVTDLKLTIPKWTSEAISQKNSWKDDLRNALLLLGDFSYQPTASKIEPLVETFLRLNARLSLVEPNEDDTLIQGCSKRLRGVIAKSSSLQSSTKALFKRFGAVLHPPYITYGDKVRRIEEIKKQLTSL